jgi:hypothetical protein
LAFVLAVVFLSEQDLQAEPLLEVFCVGFLVLTSFIVVFLPISVCDGKKILSEKKSRLDLLSA